MIRCSMLTLGTMLLCGLTANALSKPPVRLTPKNVGDQPHKLAITVDDSGLAITALGDKGTRVFRVSVGAKDPKVPLEIEGGYLHVLDGERVICRCRIHARQDKNGLLFEFEVAAAYFEKSAFGFSVANANPEERKKLPAGGGWVGYEMNLKNFAPAPENKEKSKDAPTSGVAPKWQSVVYASFANPNGGLTLKANGFLCAGEGKPREFQFLRLWRFDPKTEKWSKVELLPCKAIEIRSEKREIYTEKTDQELLALTREIALFWVEWKEDDRVVKTLLFSGPVNCQDLELTQPPKGKIATCIPFPDRAEARFVPDPEIHCKE